MFTISAELSVNLEPNDLLREYGLEKGGRVQRFIDQKVIDECTPYVPASPDRTLEFSAQVSTEVGSGLVIWNTPYARYQYYGFVMTDEAGRTWVGPGERKPIVTDRPLDYDTAQNPLAGSYWFERMKADRLNDILDEARRVMIQGE
jgi:hypothetical protein